MLPSSAVGCISIFKAHAEQEVFMWFWTFDRESDSIYCQYYILFGELFEWIYVAYVLPTQFICF